MSSKPNAIVDLPLSGLSQGIKPLPSSTERKVGRLERMVVASFELFADHGFRKVRIEQICRRANVSTRDFYKLAETKEYLLELIYQRITDHVQQCVVSALAAAPTDDFYARIEWAVDAWVRVYTDDPRFTQIGYIETVGVSPAIDKVRRLSHDNMAKVIQDEFSKRSIKGAKPLPGKLPLALIGASNELVIDWLKNSSIRDASELKTEILRVYRIVLDGISAHS